MFWTIVFSQLGPDLSGDFLRPHLSLFDPFTATLRPLTATNFPRPPHFFYGHIWAKWPWPQPPGNPAATMPFFYLRATAMCTTFLVRTSGEMVIKVASTDFKACTGTTFKWMDHNYLHKKIIIRYIRSLHTQLQYHMDNWRIKNL